MIHRISGLVLIFLLTIFSVVAQTDYTIKSRRAIRAYQEAVKYFRNGQKREALEEVNKALSADSQFVEGWLLRADLLHDMEQVEEEIKSYRRAIEVDCDFFPNVHFNLGNVLLKRGEYQMAMKSFERFLTYKDISSRNRNLANKRLEDCRFACKALDNPVDFEPENLGDSINTVYDEYWPSLTADEMELIFTSLRPVDKDLPFTGGNRQEDFYMALWCESGWGQAYPLEKPINSKSNEGAQTITADGRFMYFTACGRDDGKGRCDIYYSERVGEKWTLPMNIGSPVNTAAWEAQPSISADGRILYFVSNRKGGKGKMDIWRSRLLERFADGRQRWSKPENLSFNTPGDEMSPFIHAGNTSLYFSSDGFPGMGGLDLYRVNLTGRNLWSVPQNLGYPINTHGDESGLIINLRGDWAYFSSDRLEGRGRDIYRFALPEKAKPEPVSYLQGRIFDAVTNEVLSARVMLIDLAEGDTVAELNSSLVSGDYLVCLPAGKVYAFNAETEGYLFYSEHFSLKESCDVLNPQYLDIYLKPIIKGETVVLRNVFFDTDSWELKKESKVELDKLSSFLRQNENLKIEIGGHTDNTGNKEYNMKLSERRAKAVYDYLLGLGISNFRLSYKGYGDIQPILSNDTMEGKAQNRRTEFKIVGE